MGKTFSIIIPVLNEAEVINPLIDHLKALERSEECECIVVDGDPDGGTIKAVIHHEIHSITSRRGRSIQMNAGAAMATGEILIFLHADTRLPCKALSLISQAMTEQDLVGGAFDLRIDTHRPVLQVISVIASLRSRLTRIPYGDQAFFIRRDYFNRIGRYPEIPLMEDVVIMRRIKKAGGRIHIIREPVITSARRWECEGIFFTTVRNWFLLSAYSLGVPPGILARYYAGGKGSREVFSKNRRSDRTGRTSESDRW